MSTAAVILSVREMLTVTLSVLTPFLAAAVLASLVVGLFQASTRINDLTLSFIPRFVAVLLVGYAVSSWASEQLTAYFARSAVAMRTILW